MSRVSKRSVPVLVISLLIVLILSDMMPIYTQSHVYGINRDVGDVHGYDSLENDIGGGSSSDSIHANVNGDSIKIMTYNIQSGSGMDGKYNLSRQAEVIIESGADLVSLQEVDNNTRRHPGDDQTKILSQMTNLPHFQFAKMRDFQGGAYGVAILSRYKILESKIFHYTKPHMFKGTTFELNVQNCTDYEPEDYCQGAVAVRIRKDDSQDIWFVTTHLGLSASGASNIVQTNEAKQLMTDFIPNLISKEGEIPIVITGDFNSIPSDEAINKVMMDPSHKLHDGWVECGESHSDGFTFNSKNPFERIDYHFYTIPKTGSLSQLSSLKQQKGGKQNTFRSFKCRSASVLDTQASDHLPLLVEYEI